MRLINIDISTDLNIKRKFINSCDAMLHCQELGETQGLSILEFSLYNKPVITWNGGRCKQHLINLKGKGILFANLIELEQILRNFSRSKYKDFNGSEIVSPFLPETVMDKFKTVFIDPIVR
jgi:hypothetical protein